MITRDVLERNYIRKKKISESIFWTTQLLRKKYMNINIEVQLYFDLVNYLPTVAKDKKFSISLEEGSTIQNLLNKLGLPEDITKVILVNGIKPKSNEIQLQYGDVVAIFPPMAGG